MQEKKLENQTDVTKAVVGEFVEDLKVEDKTKPQKQIDTVVEAVAAAEADQPAVKAKAAPKKKTTTKAAPAAKPAAPAAPKKKEAKVAKKSVKSKAKSNGAAKAKTKDTPNKRVAEDAVLKVSKSFKNPYKEGTGPYERFEICAKSNGKTYGTLRGLKGLKPTTPLNFVRAGGGEFISEGK